MVWLNGLFRFLSGIQMPNAKCQMLISRLNGLFRYLCDIQMPNAKCQMLISCSIDWFKAMEMASSSIMLHERRQYFLTIKNIEIVWTKIIEVNCWLNIRTYHPYIFLFIWGTDIQILLFEEGILHLLLNYAQNLGWFTQNIFYIFEYLFYKNKLIN